MDNDNQFRSISFEISYEGEAHDEHEIDAAMLGQALSSMSQLLSESDEIINDGLGNPSLKVKAHKEGSFEVLFELAQFANSVDLLSLIGIAKQAIAINPLEAGAVIGGGTGTLIGALQALKNRTVLSVEVDDGVASLKTEDDETVDCPENVSKLLLNPSIRKKLDKLIYEPLVSEGTSLFKFKTADEQVFSEISKIDKDSFKAPRILCQKTIIKEQFTANVHFTNVNFESQNGWLMKLPNDERVKVKVEDKVFITKINANQAKFSKDDMFEVRYRTEVTNVGGEMGQTKYFIEQVIRHRVAPEKRII